MLLSKMHMLYGTERIGSDRIESELWTAKVYLLTKGIDKVLDIF